MAKEFFFFFAKTEKKLRSFDGNIYAQHFA